MRLIIVLIVLLVFSAFFSGIEAALLSLGNIRVRALVNDKVKNSKILLNLKKKPRKLITTILIGNNFVNIAAASIATAMATDYFGSKGVGIATGVMTFLILVFCEILPKIFATAHSEKTSLFFAKIIVLLVYILTPITIIFEGIANAFMRIFKADVSKPLVTEQEIVDMIEVGVQENAIEKDEREMIEGILEFNDINVEQVMTPKARMFCLNVNLSLKSALKQINKHRFSRVPVFLGSKDQIVGIVHIKSLLGAVEKKKKAKLKDIAKKPLFVSKEMIISELFKEFQKKHLHMAVVVDAYGTVIGLVTLENLMEELVGDIMDETDVQPDLMKRVDKNVVIVHGDTEIDDVNDFFNINLQKRRHYNSVGGLLHFKLKKIPKKRDKIKIGNIKLEVMEMAENRILRVRIKKGVK